MQNDYNKIVTKRYPENAEGDFYVQNDVCINCGAPEAEAPDLIEHSKKEYGHCYFKKQPQTPEEIDRAISALTVSCINGLRYGGKDPMILFRLMQAGADDVCDYLPEELIQNGWPATVSFRFEASMAELYQPLATARCSSIEVMHEEILNYYTDDNTYFEFTYKPATRQWSKMNYKGVHVAAKKYTITISRDADCPLIELLNNASFLNNYLANNKQVSQITWYNQLGKPWKQPQ